jgi:tetratricopeptide (TPR) repeat protein/CHAT domain-containing protein
MFRIVTLAFGIALLWTALLCSAIAQETQDLDALYRQFTQLRQAKRYSEALGVAQHSLGLAEKQHGSDHPHVARALSCIASVHMFQKRFTEAEPLLKRALAILEKTLGPDHAWVGTAVFELASLYHAQGRLPEAEPFYKRSLAIREKTLGLDHPDVALVDINLGLLLLTQRRFKEAEPLYKRALAGIERARGLDHPSLVPVLIGLAQIYGAQGQFAEADPIARRALGIVEGAFGQDHASAFGALNILGEVLKGQHRYAEAEPIFLRALKIEDKGDSQHTLQMATVLANLADIYRLQGRFAEAELLYKRLLAIRETALGAEHVDVAATANNLAVLYVGQGRFAEAEPLHRRALAIAERSLGANSLGVASSLNNLAELYQAQDRFAEAEAAYQRSLEIREKVLGPDHKDTGSVVDNLGLLYQGQGRFADAEPLYKRGLAIREKTLALDHPDLGKSLNNLAGLYRELGRAEAEPLYKRALTIAEKAFGPQHVNVGAVLNNLAYLYIVQGRLAEAEPLYQRSLEIAEKGLGSKHPSVGAVLDNMAGLYHAQRRFPEAEKTYQRALKIRQETSGPDSPAVGTTLNNLAGLYRDQGRYAEAEPFYRRSLALAQKMLPPDHPNVVSILNNLAGLHLLQSHWSEAAELWGRSSTLTASRAQRDVATLARAPTGKAEGVTGRLNHQFASLVKVSHRLALSHSVSGSELASKTFIAAQWSQRSQAAGALAQMAARVASSDPALARVVRERQDLVIEWQTKDRQRVAQLSEPLSRRNKNVEATVSDRLAAIDGRILEIDAVLAKSFPDYAALARSAPIEIAEVQSLLRETEALVLFLDTQEFGPTPDETFIWVISKTDVRWARAELGTSALWREIAALRCGLDFHGAWIGLPCRQLLGRPYSETDYLAGKPLPFDLERSHRLYRTLFGETADLIRGKDLLIVPSGPLTLLPFQVLISEAPASSQAGLDAMRSARWLVRDHSIAVLPSVSSLKALRLAARPSRASKPYFGIANPLLIGPDRRFAALASQAAQRQACNSNKAKAGEAAPIVGEGAGLSPTPLSSADGLARPAVLRQSTPLPETADEVCRIAHHLKAQDADVRLGANATETELKTMSERGTLANYRVLHFATHGAVAGAFLAKSEPGLILTPPEIATGRDDGFLTASEVAGLKLDADWVILSACYTAAGGAENAEALSGLASAFFYAGARALLVSHWAVNSQMAVHLTTTALASLTTDPGIGRAEALRRAMLKTIDKGEHPATAHPAFWAPFVIVGEGSVLQR